VSKARPGAIHKTAGSTTNLPAGGMESISARGGAEVCSPPLLFVVDGKDWQERRETISTIHSTSLLFLCRL